MGPESGTGVKYLLALDPVKFIPEAGVTPSQNQYDSVPLDNILLMLSISKHLNNKLFLQKWQENEKNVPFDPLNYISISVK